jgi:co-chaperonin GroES (HSP10)
MKIKAIADKIIATDMEVGTSTTAGGIIVKDDIGKAGASNPPRWFTVASMGPESKFHGEFEVGDRILVDHGRWTEHIKVEGEKFWAIDPKGISAVQV